MDIFIYVRAVFGRYVPASKIELLERTLEAVLLCILFYGVVMYPDESNQVGRRHIVGKAGPRVRKRSLGHSKYGRR